MIGQKLEQHAVRNTAVDDDDGLDHLGVDRAAFIGWSDGAVTALVLSDTHAERSAGVFFFACNVDATGTKPFVYTDIIGRCLDRHRKDYAALSSTPDDFDAVFEAVGTMQRSQPNLGAADLSRIGVPVWSVLGEGDEFIRPDTSLEGLGKLKPSFEMMGQMGFDATALRKYSQVERINHVHTPGNSSGIVDGAALMLVGSEAKGRQLGLTPRGRIIATAVTGSDPTIMLTGPAPATRKALAKSGLSIDDIDLFEVNEAFASVVLKFMKELRVPEEKVNVNGGAIAMGHPLGATGCIILATLLDELERRQLRYGLATLCVGGGMGIATIIERV